MNVEVPKRRSQEIELKLALPSSDIEGMQAALKKSPLLARRKLIKQTLHSVYYDTPDQTLRQKRIAMRVRQIESDKKSTWIQTLKTGDMSASALSTRGEWEQAVPSADLCIDALEDSPWHDIDPDGAIFRELQPCFMTRFERTSWNVRGHDGSVAEVSLDIGQIEAGSQSAAICELEIELISGEPSALFVLANSISKSVAVIPANLSKAERGYALAHAILDMPLRARPPQLTADIAVVEACQLVLRETYSQFTGNLGAFQTTDNPEVVHQTRVGWRRFKSALRLFKPALSQERIPDLSPLKPLLQSLSHLRDLDVALTETLPSIASSYIANAQDRKKKWDHLEHSLSVAAGNRRQEVRDTLQDPTVGVTLLAISRFIEECNDRSGRDSQPVVRPLKPWAQRRVEKLREKVEFALKSVDDEGGQHRARILVKRLRYSVESMQAVLPTRRARRWLKRAIALQGSIGSSRDIQRAHTFAVELQADPDLVEFLRGFGCGLAYGRDHFRI